MRAKPPNTSSARGDDLLYDETEEHFYSLVDEFGNPAKGYRYDLYVNGKIQVKAARYEQGQTVKVTGATETRLVSWLESDSGRRA
jgi:hypothetical protein